MATDQNPQHCILPTTETKQQNSKVTMWSFKFLPGTNIETIEKLGKRFIEQEGATVKYQDHGIFIVGPFETVRARKRAKGILREYTQVDHHSLILFFIGNLERVWKEDEKRNQLTFNFDSIRQNDQSPSIP